MRVRSKIIRISLVVLGILLICGLGVLLGAHIIGGPEKYKVGAETGDVVSLAAPALSASSDAFPADEAGISAYVNIGQSINLQTAKNAFVGIEAEGDDYVIGTIALTGLPEDEFPHVYVTQDGWIVAYYTKFAPASRIFQWYGYNGGSFTTTTLEDAIAKICATIGVSYSSVKGNVRYYHFQYPEATKLLVAVDRVSQQFEDAFDFSVPYDVALYECSWSHSIKSGSGEYSRLYLDGNEINRVNYSFDRPELSLARCGEFTDAQLVRDVLHVIRITLSYYGSSSSWAGAALVFIYRPL